MPLGSVVLQGRGILHTRTRVAAASREAVRMLVVNLSGAVVAYHRYVRIYPIVRPICVIIRVEEHTEP